MALVLGALRPEAHSVTGSCVALCRIDWTVLGYTRWGPHAPAGQDPKKIAEVVRYFDPANFAHRIRCPVQLNFGLFDWCAPAEGLFSAINALPRDTQCSVVVDPYGGHFTFNHALVRQGKRMVIPRWEGTADDNKVAR